MDKEKIIDVTFNFIVANGLEQLSIAKLAKELGCTKSSIYNYFKSKDELLNDVFLEYTRRFFEVTKSYEDPEEALRAYAKYSFENPEIFLFFHKYAKSTFINPETKAMVRQYKCRDFQLLEDLSLKLNGTSEYSKVIMHSLVFGPIFSVVMAFNYKHVEQVTLEEVDELVDSIIRSVRKEQ